MCIHLVAHLGTEELVQVFVGPLSPVTTCWPLFDRQFSAHLCWVLGEIQAGVPRSSYFQQWAWHQFWHRDTHLHSWGWRKRFVEATLYGYIVAMCCWTRWTSGVQWCNDSSLLTDKLVPILIPFKRFDQSWFDWPKACMQVMKLFNPNPMFWVMSWPRHTFTTRWLFTGISSHLYYGDWTLDDLLAELTGQAIDAFESGICDPWCVPKKKLSVPFDYWTLVGVGCFRVSMCPFHLALASEDVNGTRLRLVCIGTKGDWVFLRKAP